jgi:hypothetical protein
MADTLTNDPVIDKAATYSLDSTTGLPVADKSTGQAKHVTLATLIAGEDQDNDLIKVEQRFAAANISTATTTTVKASAGFLHSITINTPVASSVITIYDNTAGSGTKIGTITLPAVLLQQGPYTALFDVVFNTGLTIVTATGASDITVSWR